MANSRTQRRASLTVETLETRDAPSASPLVIESFDRTPRGTLPTGWQQWNNEGTNAYTVSSSRLLSGLAGLASTGDSALTGRAWDNVTLPADVQTSASVYLDSSVPIQILARGQKLNTTTPSYYAVSVTSGVKLQLIREVNGVATVLGTLNAASGISNQWVQITLDLSGSNVRAQVLRLDTWQYLNSSGQWQTTQTWALSKTDTAITSGGLSGLARPSGAAGTVTVDDFNVVQPDGENHITLDTFDRTKTGSSPAGWAQWASTGSAVFTASTTKSSSGLTALSATGTSSVAALGWLNTPFAADAQASAAVYLNSLIPLQVFVRGNNLGTATPSYYAVAVTRGLQLQLLRVANGATTVLGTLNSATWIDQQWVRITLDASGTSLRVQVRRLDTNQFLNSSGQWQSTATWALTRTDNAITVGGKVGVGRSAGYAGTSFFDDFLAGDKSSSTTTPPPTPSTQPTAPQHYPNIRIAELAYAGTPLDSFAQNLLKNSVDLVIPDSSYLQEISNIAPDTPTPIYTNLSNLYQTLLTDWLNYADAHGISRESAFYHVTQATSFSGSSPASQPVSWFWGVYRAGVLPQVTDLTQLAHSSSQFALGAAGESVYIAYPEKYREININLASGAGTGWSAVVEYATAVDAYGNPTAWAPLKTLSNTTNGFTRTGQILFDPPSNWVPSAFNGSTARMYYVRIRTVNGGTAPVSTHIYGRDYVSAGGGTKGTIPAFDYAADTNHDGYLSDSEYAHRATGKNARFAYESRLFYSNYGQMRFATNPASTGFQSWAVDYTSRILSSRPLANGLFVDNATGTPPAGAGKVIESVSTYAQGFATMLSEIRQKIAPRWVIINADGSTDSDPLVQQSTAYFQEFALRPLAQNYSQFENEASVVARRLAMTSPSTPYAILDSYYQGGSPTDPRTQLATLAYYYLIGDPTKTFLDFFGGNEPSSSWTRHWVPAAAYNIGKPAGNWSVLATGADPRNHTFTYRVYQRYYTNALVLYKPLSKNSSGTSGTTDNGTATTLKLNATYRVLNADNTLGAPITQITLRNGEGAILIKS